MRCSHFTIIPSVNPSFKVLNRVFPTLNFRRMQRPKSTFSQLRRIFAILLLYTVGACIFLPKRESDFRLTYLTLQKSPVPIVTYRLRIISIVREGASMAVETLRRLV